jgi:actin family MreB-like protein
MTGRHDLGGGKAVTVGKALALAQPQGALVHYASEHQKMAEIGNEQSLIIDPGSRTFDWLVARGMRLVQKQSYSFNRGMSDVLRLLATEITKDIGSPYRDYDAIDLALRTGKSPVIFQKPYDMLLHRHLRVRRGLADGGAAPIQGRGAATQRLGTPGDPPLLSEGARHLRRPAPMAPVASCCAHRLGGDRDGTSVVVRPAWGRQVSALAWGVGCTVAVVGFALAIAWRRSLETPAARAERASRPEALRDAELVYMGCKG